VPLQPCSTHCDSNHMALSQQPLVQTGRKTFTGRNGALQAERTVFQPFVHKDKRNGPQVPIKVFLKIQPHYLHPSDAPTNISLYHPFYSHRTYLQSTLQEVTSQDENVYIYIYIYKYVYKCLSCTYGIPQIWKCYGWERVIRECGSVLYFGMAKEILAWLCITRIMAKKSNKP